MDWSAARVSVALGLTTVGLLLPAGIWAGHALARRHFRGKVIVEAAVAIPLILPPTVLGFYLLHTFSTGSALGAAFQQVMGHALAFSFPGLVLASAVANIPFVVQPASHLPVDGGERLVQQQYPRLTRQGTRHRDSLLLAP